MTGAELVKLRQDTVSFIFQDSNLLPHHNALNNVAQPLLHQGELARPARQRAQDLLERLGVGDRALGMPEELSGGEQQRVAVARALVHDPSFVLADEPTGNLDSGSTEALMKLFYELNAEGTTIILITHDREVAEQFPRRVELKDGRIEFDSASGRAA